MQVIKIPSMSKLLNSLILITCIWPISITSPWVAISHEVVWPSGGQILKNNMSFMVYTALRGEFLKKKNVNFMVYPALRGEFLKKYVNFMVSEV